MGGTWQMYANVLGGRLKLAYMPINGTSNFPPSCRRVVFEFSIQEQARPEESLVDAKNIRSFPGCPKKTWLCEVLQLFSLRSSSLMVPHCSCVGRPLLGSPVKRHDRRRTHQDIFTCR